MFFLWRLLRPSKPAQDDETILSTLAAKIQTRQTLLAAIRLRERNATLLATLCAFAGWSTYIVFWWFGGQQTQVRARGLRGLPVLAGPVLVLLVRRAVQAWYNPKGNAEEKTLQTLLKEQRAKVEEITKKTKFYSTRKLLARYDNEDDETILSTLTAKIQARQSLLAAIRLRERNATLLATLYALAAWSAYVAFWWFGGWQTQMRARGLRALPVLAGPVLVLLVRRVMQVWYSRKGNTEEKKLQALLKEQRAKVEEIKKKFSFYSTRELLARYDAATPNFPQQQQQRPPGPQTPQRVSASTANPNPNGNKNPNNINTNNKSSTSNTAPPPPSQRKWFDAVADLLVGAEDPALAVRDKFALICSKCFAHNGLVPEAMWVDAKYICPRCGHFNSNLKSSAGGAQSPTLPTYVSPASASAFGRPSAGGGQ
ncbi:hypothetical protein C8R44DRAFT_328601 [Mycena epipterygia]|nr:hypothetical protein C8R44DRAFT_328601 [Mycena epipterygia]